MDDKKTKDTSNVIREIKFAEKENQRGKMHVIDENTMAFLVEYKPDTNTIDFYYQGHKFDSAVFDSLLDGTASFYSLASHIIDKMQSWRSKWIPKKSN